MNKSSLAESRSKANTIMKQQGTRVNLILCLVKFLISGSWYNDNSDNLGNLSIFFISPCDHLNDEENLRLSLKISEGKELSGETINQLLKKEYYIPTNNFELRKQLRIITIFKSTFLGTGLAAKEDKRLFEPVQKRDI